MTSGGDHWRPVQTCSFGDTPERHLVVAIETEALTVSKAGGTNLTGMLSFYFEFIVNLTYRDFDLSTRVPAASSIGRITIG